MNGMAAIDQLMSIEVNYDPGLKVGVQIFDDSGISPALLLLPGNVNGVMPMLNVIDTLYRLQFTPAAVGSYIFRKAVYTDDSYLTLAPDYSRASESVQVVDVAALILNANLAMYNIPGSVGAAIALGAKQPVDFVGYVD